MTLFSGNVLSLMTSGVLTGNASSPISGNAIPLATGGALQVGLVSIFYYDSITIEQMLSISALSVAQKLNGQCKLRG